jgi:hypothetical protein
MESPILDVKEWAQQQFGDCQFGDLRLTKRLVTCAAQAAAHPDAHTPEQMRGWRNFKAMYRFVDNDRVTHPKILAPHGRHTRQRSPGTYLVLCDTTEVSYLASREIEGLGPTGNGGGQGFLLHSALLTDAGSGELVGLAEQELFYRKPRKDKQESSAQRKKRPRESEVWGRVIDRVGPPPQGAMFIDVCDRGADDFEFFAHCQQQEHEWVIRTARLERAVFTVNAKAPEDPQAGKRLSVRDLLESLPVVGQYELELRGTKKTDSRTATVEVRHGSLWMPRPQHTSGWTRRHAPQFMRMDVIDVREVGAPRGVEPLHWVLYVSWRVKDFEDAWRAIEYYEKRWLIEEYHKALKTGCNVEGRQYTTAARLERITAVLSVLAVRLLQLKTIARAQPDRAAAEVVPRAWLRTLYEYCRQTAPRWARKWPLEKLTVHEFFRNLAMLGGFLGRKSDGEPGWIVIWRGLEKLLLIMQGFRLAKKCG